MTPREHWHGEVTNSMELDATLLELIPENDRDLARLPTHLREPVIRKIDELVGDCCLKQKNGLAESTILQQLSEDTWNFLKPWKPHTVRT